MTSNMSYVLNENESCIIINDNALLDDTIEGLLDRTDNKFTLEQVKAYLDDNVMSRIVEAMFNAQSNEIVEIAREMEEQAAHGGFI